MKKRFGATDVPLEKMTSLMDSNETATIEGPTWRLRDCRQSDRGGGGQRFSEKSRLAKKWLGNMYVRESRETSFD